MLRIYAVIGWLLMLLLGGGLIAAGVAGQDAAAGALQPAIGALASPAVGLSLGAVLLLADLLAVVLVLRRGGVVGGNTITIADEMGSTTIEISALEEHLLNAIAEDNRDTLYGTRLQICTPRRKGEKVRVDIYARVAATGDVPGLVATRIKQRVREAFLEVLPVAEPPQVQAQIEIARGPVVQQPNIAPSPSTLSGRSALRAPVSHESGRSQAAASALRAPVRPEPKPEAAPAAPAPQTEDRNTPPPSLFMGEIRYPVDDEDEDEQVEP